MVIIKVRNNRLFLATFLSILGIELFFLLINWVGDVKKWCSDETGLGYGCIKISYPRDDYDLRITHEVSSEFEEPVLYLRATVSSVNEKWKLRKYILSTGTSPHQKEGYLKSLRSSSKHISLKLENKTLASGLNGWTLGYAVSLRFPSKVSIADEVHDDATSEPTHVVELYARIEYRSISSALLDENETEELAFIGAEAFVEEIPLVLQEGEIDLQSWFSDWVVSPTGAENDFDVNYVATESTDSDLSKCSHRRLVTWFEPSRGTSPKATVSRQSPLLSRYQLVILGDSQPIYECRRLQSFLNHSDGEFVPLMREEQRPMQVLVSVECIEKKGAITIDNEWESWLSQTLSRLQQTRLASTERVLLFNFAGLWDAAYGQLHADQAQHFRARASRLLTLLKDSARTVNQSGPPDPIQDRLYYLTTTAVNPIHYPGLPTDPKKIAMNQVRVELINDLMNDIISAQFRDSISIIETGELSKVGEDDPKTPTDMRHFGVVTNDKLVNLLLCSVFQAFL